MLGLHYVNATDSSVHNSFFFKMSKFLNAKSGLLGPKHI